MHDVMRLWKKKVWNLKKKRIGLEIHETHLYDPIIFIICCFATITIGTDYVNFI